MACILTLNLGKMNLNINERLMGDVDSWDGVI